MNATQKSLNKMARSLDRTIAPRDPEPRSGTVEICVQISCKLSYQRTRSHLLGPLSPVTPSFFPDFASHLSSRNSPIHGETFHQVEFTIHAFYHFFGRNLFQRVLLKIETISDNLFKVCPADLQKFLMAVRMYCSKHRCIRFRGGFQHGWQFNWRRRRCHLFQRYGYFVHDSINQNIT